MMIESDPSRSASDRQPSLSNDQRIVVRDLYERAAPPVARKPGFMAAAGSVLVGFLLDIGGLETVPSICLAAVLFPIFLMVARKRIATDIAAETVATGEARLREFLLAPPVMIDLAAIGARSRKGTVLTGAAYDGSWFYVVEDGVAARIPMHMIRSWKWKIAGYETHQVCGAGGFQQMGATAMAQIEANRNNVARQVEAWRNSGLFVQVANIHHPTWQFVTRDKVVLERWHEILTQLREGRLKAH